jgi:hypothetical protein
MKQRIGIYFVIAAFVLTWPFHVGAASFLLAEAIGNFFAPHQDHILFWLPIAAIGGIFTILLIINLLRKRKMALYTTAVLFLAGVGTLSIFFPHPSIDWTFHIYDWILCVGLAVLFILSAIYLFWIAVGQKLFSRLF